MEIKKNLFAEISILCLVGCTDTLRICELKKSMND